MKIATFDSTKQEIFDYVFESVVKQGKPSRNNSNDCLCLYRGEGGTKCAIGFLIPDSKYKKAYEDLSISNIMRTLGYDKDANVAKFNFLADLQRAHDKASAYGDDFVPEFVFNMNNVADKHTLKRDVIDEYYKGKGVV